jgi:transcriptional regulator with XRE-family HTH domain
MSETYPNWDITAPALPPRSRLFNLRPEGLGTAEVESLTGYITRLAQEHSMSAHAIVTKEIAACMIGSRVQAYTLVGRKLSRLLNGVGDVPLEAVSALEGLTFRQDVRFTTMLTWTSVLSPFELMRHARAWCPACYQERLDAGSPVYEQLIWTFEAVTLCPVHKRPLAGKCPHCDRELPLLSAGSRPGHCSLCYRWLGVSAWDGAGPGEELDEGLEAARQIGGLLAAAPGLPALPSREQFVKNLRCSADQATWGRINDFAALVGLWHVAVRRLLEGRQAPTIKMLLKICRRLNVSSLNLLTASEDIVVPGREGVLESLRKHQAKRARQRRAEPMSFDDTEKEVTESLTELPPPSMREVARRTGRHASVIERRFPALYAKVVARYSEFNRQNTLPDEEAEAILRAALSEEPPPSLQSLFRRIGCTNTGYRYYDRFPALCLAIAERYKQHRNKPLDVDEIVQAMEAALVEEPPPSFSEVMRRLNLTRGFIAHKFPELSRAVAARYMEYSRAAARERKNQLHQAVTDAMKAIHTQGLYVSEQRVLSRLSNPVYGKTLKKILRKVKRELGLID